MTTLRLIRITILVGLFCGAATVTVLFTTPRVPRASADPLLERWRNLDQEQQQAYIAQHAALVRQPDGAAILRRAQTFAELSARERDYLHQAHELMREALARMTVADRAWLRSLPERARAEAIYRVAAAQLPNELAELRAVLDAGP